MTNYQWFKLCDDSKFAVIEGETSPLPSLKQIVPIDAMYLLNTLKAAQMTINSQVSHVIHFEDHQ